MHLRALVLVAIACALAACSSGGSSPAAPPAEPFALVLADEKTTESLGMMPFDRSVWAQAIDACHVLGAKAVVLKFFFDQPRSEEGDAALAEAMGKLHVVLEANLNLADAEPNPLPDRFFLNDPADNDTLSLHGNAGQLPIERLSERAYDVGFVNVATPDRIPTLERYRGRYVKSLYVCCVELALDAPANITPGQSIVVGSHHLPLNAFSERNIRWRANNELHPISLVDLIQQRVRRSAIEGKVVIIGADVDMPKMPTPLGRETLHRAFYLGLLAFYDELIGKDARKADAATHK